MSEPVPALLLALQRQAGNRAVAMAVQRWYEPKPGSPTPRSGCPPVSPKQTDGLRWDDNGKEPRNAYRFVDDSGQGWESPGTKQPFAKSDWNQHVEKKDEAGEKKKREKSWWFDVTEGKWRDKIVPETYRAALAAERPSTLEGLGRRGYDSADQVPVYVKMRYRPKPDSHKSTKTRTAELRTLDRAARVLAGALVPEVSSPHLATLPIGGSLQIAGNTGTRHVRSEEAAHAEELLAAARDPGKPLPTGRRSRKDALKLRALATGDYQAHHKKESASLGGLAATLQLPARWRNVGVSGGPAEHGELTLLGSLLEDMRAHRRDPGAPVIVYLGGVKLACQACWWALGAFNEHLARPLGYRVKASGTHLGLFPGWRMPDYLWNIPEAKAGLARNLPGGWSFDKNGVLSEDKPGPEQKNYQDPEESGSDWEEVRD